MTNTETTYNGYTNYATWRVMLEHFNGDERELDAETCKDLVEEYLEISCENDMTLSYALAFTHNVNWYEISDALKNK